ncbi:Quinol monooxygenase YgiN [Amphibacillus marinus]|uniref:Quinol monooxygenase YgiN n=1 Tax=Amphibacillus marinus TaxID=872970 RepID=A0A1H8LBZ8_9BACI|nr:putative quinol monooxygenase [Amphibacillus marinus]SEO02579.1 Quinol monooxygenase YgiN [Amphibacillus marinus]
MLSVSATFFIKPDQQNSFLADVKQLIASSRAEAGCSRYALYQSISSDNEFVMIENWQDQASLDQHNQNPDLINFIKHIGEYSSAKPIVQVAEVK